MPIPEPRADLWLAVKPRVDGWIETDEDAMRDLGQQWTDAGTVFGTALPQRPAGFVGPVPPEEEWPDKAGLTWTMMRLKLGDDLKIQQAELNGVAALASAFAEDVAYAKQQIVQTIEANSAAYELLFTAPGGVDAAAQETFVAEIARAINTFLDEMAGMIADRQPGVAAAAERPAVDVELAGTAGVPPPPPEGADPAVNAAYWASLSEAQRQKLISEQPELVGSRDGFSAVHRDQANRILLDRERADLRHEIDQLRDERAGPYGQLRIQPRIDALADKLGELDQLHDRLDPAAQDRDGYFLLGFDAEGDGRAIVARGNPDTATNVATWIPGANTNLSSFATPAGGPTTIDRLDALHGAAERAGSDSTSVIGWLDYDSPPFHAALVDPRYALDASKDLDSFQHGLAAAHVGPDSHSTVLGHSYGSTVAGVAASKENLPIDEFVAVGSVGLTVHHVSELNLAPEHVWVTETTADSLADSQAYIFHDSVPPLGADPSTEQFGARVFDSDADVPLPSGPHSQYVDDDPNNIGLTNLGRIIAGDPPPVEEPQ